MTKQRQLHIDNIRVLLTVLVVLHHLAITYGGPGGWYYHEVNSNQVAVLLMTLFVATNQSFFMGMFFMISAYFLEKSLRRKPPLILIKDRLRRLGIPLIFYGFIVSPFLIFLLIRYVDGRILSIPEFFNTATWVTFGPLWFVAALLLFSGITLLIKLLKGNNQESKNRLSMPSNQKIIAFTIVLGVLSFVTRIWFPVGWTLRPFGFQLGHFPQYIVLFIIGYQASKYDWLNQITYRQSMNWLKGVVVMVFILFPLVFHFGEAATKGTDIFIGGLYWQSLVFSLWEQLVGIGIIIVLLGLFKEKYTTQTLLLKNMSASAYTVYIFHSVILVLLALLIKNVELSATLKFIISAPIVLFLCFWISNLIRKLPFAKGIL